MLSIQFNPRKRHTIRRTGRNDVCGVIMACNDYAWPTEGGKRKTGGKLVCGGSRRGGRAGMRRRRHLYMAVMVRSEGICVEPGRRLVGW